MDGGRTADEMACRSLSGPGNQPLYPSRLHGQSLSGMGQPSPFLCPGEQSPVPLYGASVPLYEPDVPSAGRRDPRGFRAGALPGGCRVVGRGDALPEAHAAADAAPD